MREEDKREIKKQLAGIAKKRHDALGSINLDKLNLNPFLLRLLSLNTPREIAEFMVLERLERSVVTSYGTRIQTIAKILAERGTGVEGADICKEKDGKRYYIQMKAGPNTPDKDIMSQINILLRSAVRRNRGSVALLGMTYGKRDKVSNIIQKYSQVDWIIGKEFWNFLSDNPNCAEELFKLVEEVADVYGHEELKLDEKIDEIAEEIKKRYGDGGKKMWKNIFEDNF